MTTGGSVTTLNWSGTGTKNFFVAETEYYYTATPGTGAPAALGVDPVDVIAPAQTIHAQSYTLPKNTTADFGPNTLSGSPVTLLSSTSLPVLSQFYGLGTFEYDFDTFNMISASNPGYINLGGVSTTVSAQLLTEYTYTPPQVPEPETYAMLVAGLGVIGLVARRRRQRA
jgi:hypothetical protein